MVDIRLGEEFKRQFKRLNREFLLAHAYIKSVWRLRQRERGKVVVPE